MGEIISTQMPPLPPRKLWTRKECSMLVEMRILEPGGFELIEGEIVQKMWQKRSHARTVIRLVAYLIRIFGEEFVQSQLPIDVSQDDRETNEPEPDGAVTALPESAYPEASPGPADLRLVVEVSDSTLFLDRSRKALLYARAGIVEYWVIDVNARRILVHLDPRDGEYRALRIVDASESIAPQAAPSAVIFVESLLP